MKVISDYIFPVSISSECLKDKLISKAMTGSRKDPKNKEIRKAYGFKASSGLSYSRKDVTPKELLTNLLHGHVFCNLFQPTATKKDGTFGSSQKNNSTFEGAYVVCVDIDETRYDCVESYVEELSLKPTFYYTSYSNMMYDDLGISKGARFRLVYVFDKLITDKYVFRYIASSINNIIEQDVNEPIHDKCNINCTQYFNGTNVSNPELNVSYRLTNIIYSFSDINYNLSDYIEYLSRYAEYKVVDDKKVDEIQQILFSLTGKNFQFNSSAVRFEPIERCEISAYESNPKKQNTLADSISPHIIELLHLYDILNKEEFKRCPKWEEIRKNTKYVYRVEKAIWEKGLYQKVDENYFALYFPRDIIRDGMNRRKSLYQRMCLRRYICPEINGDELIANILIDILRFYDNTDGVLNSEFIKKNAQRACTQSISDIETEYALSIKKLRELTFPKRGIIYKNKTAYSRETTFIILDDLYDAYLPVKENLENIQYYGFKISKTTLYAYLKNRGIRTTQDKYTDDEIKNLIDPSKTFYANQKILKESGIFCAKRRLKKLYNSMKTS